MKTLTHNRSKMAQDVLPRLSVAVGVSDAPDLLQCAAPAKIFGTHTATLHQKGLEVCA